MADPIFPSRSDDGWTEVAETPFETEDELEEVVAANPQLLCDSFTQGFPQRLLLIDRQQGVRISEQSAFEKEIDLLFVDQDAVPTLVEVKLRKNGEIKRRVIGQMLEYAAYAKFWTAQDLRATATRTHSDWRQAIRELIGELISDDHEELFWQTVAENLSSGKMHLGLVADEIPEETQDVLEFLQEQMPAISVFGIEIRAVADIAGGYQSRLVVPNPRLREERAKRTRPQTSQTPSGFMTREQLMTLIPEHAHDAVGQLFDTAIEHGAEVRGERQETVIEVPTAAWKNPVKIAFFTPLDGKDAKNAWGRNATFGFGANQFSRTPPGHRLGDALSRWSAYFKQLPYATDKGPIHPHSQLREIKYDALSKHIDEIRKRLAAMIEELRALPSE